MVSVSAPFSPTLFRQPLDRYEGARILSRLENKSCLTQKANLIHILNLTIMIIGPVLSPFNPFLPKQPLYNRDGQKIKKSYSKFGSDVFFCKISCSAILVL